MKSQTMVLEDTAGLFFLFLGLNYAYKLFQELFTEPSMKTLEIFISASETDKTLFS